VTLPPRDALTAFDLLLLEAMELSEKAHERLEVLYRRYPSDDLRETVERLSRVSLDLSSLEKRGDGHCADNCSDASFF
jgi:hypothetical protein